MNPNLRKAAVFLRSLDAETASTLLAQLAPGEVTALRDAIRALGSIDPEEAADVAAEFRSAQPLAAEAADRGVELQITSTEDARREAGPSRSTDKLPTPGGKRFEFLEQAPLEFLVPCLSREHPQTIAVVLSHLAPHRAADVLGALPAKLQAETMERLASLGETDPESVVVLESELAAWLAKRTAQRAGSVRGRDTASSVLAAADVLTRGEIVKNLRSRNAPLAAQLSHTPSGLRHPRANAISTSNQAAEFALRIAKAERQHDAELSPRRPSRPMVERPRTAPPPLPPPLPRFQFDELIHLDSRTLSAVISNVDPQLLVLALVSSTDELADRVCRQLPRRTARAFRRQLRRLGPTRLSDVEAAQRTVATVAARQLAAMRVSSTTR